MFSVQSRFIVREIGRNGTGIIWIANESKKNALNAEMLLELKDSLEAFEQDKTIRCITIAGKGHHFSIGVDLEEIRNNTKFIHIDQVLDTMRKPVIAAVHGYVVRCLFGGYFGLAWRWI